MRNVKAILAAAVVAAGIGSSASAITMTDLIGSYLGPITIKYSNFDEGVLYNISTPGTYDPALIPVDTTSPYANPSKIPAPSLSALTGGKFADGDSWGILRVKEIDDKLGNILWQAPLPSNTSPSAFEISGIFWGEKDTKVIINNNATVTVDGIDMSFAFYADYAKNFNPYAVTQAASIATAIDGQLIWTANTVPGVVMNDPSAEFTSTYVPDTNGVAFVQGSAWADLGAVVINGGSVVGDLNSMFGEIAADHDISIQFTGLTVQEPWLVNSEDPVKGVAVPTPTAVWGGVMLAGFVGMSIIRRRRAE